MLSDSLVGTELLHLLVLSVVHLVVVCMVQSIFKHANPNILLPSDMYLQHITFPSSANVQLTC